MLIIARLSFVVVICEWAEGKSRQRSIASREGARGPEAGSSGSLANPAPTRGAPMRNAAKGVLTDWAASYLTSVLTGGIMAGCLLCPANERQVPRAGLSALVRPRRASSPGAIRPMVKVDGAWLTGDEVPVTGGDKLWFRLRQPSDRRAARSHTQTRAGSAGTHVEDRARGKRADATLPGRRRRERVPAERETRAVHSPRLLRHPHPLTGGDREASRVGDQTRGKPWRGS